MSKSKLTLGAVGFVILATLLFLVLQLVGTSPAEPLTGTQDEPLGTQTRTGAHEGEDGVLRTTQQDPIDTRSVLPPGSTTLIVVDGSGHAIAGAVVSISSAETTRSWHEFDLEERAHRSPHLFRGLTDETGAVTIPTFEKDAAPGPYYLWATHAEHRARWMDFEPDAPANAAGLRMTLGDAGMLDAEVRSTLSDLVVGASFLQGCPLSNSAIPGNQHERNQVERETIARENLVRIVKPGADGHARLFLFPGTSLVQAVAGATSSQVRLVTPTRESITLDLLPNFQLAGDAACAEGAVGEVAVLRVHFSVGGTEEYLASFQVAANGPFGPFSACIPEHDELWVTLESPCGATIAEVLEDVRPGELRNVHFAPPEVPVSWFRIVDREGVPVRNAHVMSAWLAGDRWLDRSARSDADGFVHVEGLGAKDVYLNITHPAYVRTQGTPARAYAPRKEAPIIEMEPGRSLSGLVRVAGKPADEFSIFYWTDSPEDYSRLDFRDRQDGRFVIPQVSTRTLHLLATGPRMGASAIVDFPADANPGRTVVFDCASSGGLSVHVTDSSTGEAVPEATLHVHARMAQSVFHSISLAQETGSTGDAHFEYFPDSASYLSVETEGYSDHMLVMPVVSPGTPRPDLNVVIDRDQPLRFALTPWPQEAWETVWVRVQQPILTEYDTLSTSGSIDLGEIPVGDVDLLIVFPDGSAFFLRRTLQAGSPAEWIVEADSRNEVVVELENRDSLGPENILCEFVTTTPDVPVLGVRAVIDENGLVTMHGLPHRTGVMRASLKDGTVLAERVLTREDLHTGHVSLSLSSREIDVLVSRPDGKPASNVPVYAIPEHAPYGLVTIQHTDADGLASLRRSGNGRDRLFAVDGSSVSEVVLFDSQSKDSARQELRLRTPVTTQFTALGAGPNAEVSLYLFLPNLRTWIAEASTATPLDISPGRYAVDLTTPGLWLDTPVVEVPAAGGSVEVGVRRLGGLRVVAPEVGAALVGLELVDGVSGEHVAEWLARGLVREEAGADGARQWQGLPVGQYAWTAEFADGRVAEGEVQIESLALIELALPAE